MKTLFLSFNDKYFKPLLCGIKKYEYRKRFCDEETICYLYLSGKARKTVGILYLGRPIKLEKIMDACKNNPDTFKRVEEYLQKGIKNAVPIKQLSLFKEPISLEILRKKFNNFMPPQMYYNLDNNKDLLNYLEKQEVEKTIFKHDHDKVYFDNLCVSVKDLEQTEIFKKINVKYEELYKKYEI